MCMCTRNLLTHPIGPRILQKSTHNLKSMRHGCFINKPLNLIKINMQSNDYCAYHFANKSLCFLQNQPGVYFFMEIFTYTPKRLKIFAIRFKLHKNSSKIHLNF
jgi:hypothetical protein